MKTSKIISSTFINAWTIPGTKNVLHYYLLKFDNGEEGKVGVVPGNVITIAEGATLTYKLNADKIEIIREAMTTGSNKVSHKGNGHRASGHTFGGKGPVKQTDYLGYVCGYAKDLVVAGKTKPADVRAFMKIVDEIYDHVGKKIKESTPPPAEVPKQ